MDIFIGDKEEFGVEIKSAHLFNEKNPYGNARIWLGGNFFGSIHDAIYLDGYLLGGLLEIDKAPFLDSQRLSGDCQRNV